MSQARRNNLFLTLCHDLLEASYSKAVAYPLNRVKLLKQASPWKEECNNLGGITSSISDIIDAQGWGGLNKGLLPDILRFVPANLCQTAINRVVWQTFIVLFHKGDKSAKKSQMANIIVGSLSGCLSLLVVYPFDTITTRLALDYPNETYTGIVDCARTTIRQHGFSSLWAGYFVSCIGIATYRAAYFLLADLLVNKETDRNARFVMYTGVSSFAGWLTYPLDSIRRYQMMNPRMGSIGTCAELADAGGIRAFFAGSWPNFLRSVVASIVTYLMEPSSS